MNWIKMAHDTMNCVGTISVEVWDSATRFVVFYVCDFRRHGFNTAYFQV